jgi:hypothetical protein
MNKRKQAQLLGILFAEYQILTTEQASIVRSQMDKPTHVFEDSSSLWAFYNYVTTALQSSHPKTWMEDQRVLHYFISSVNNFAKPLPIQPETTVNDEEEKVVDPLLTNYGQPENQTNLLIQIAEAEAETAEVEEIEEIKVEQENKVCDEIVTYTDPMGNIFETPVFDVIDLNKDTKMSVMISPCAAHDAESDFMDGIDESIEPEVVSLEPTPEDHLVFEAQQKENEDDFAFDFSEEEDDDSVFF